MSVALPPDLRIRHRAVTIVAGALLAAVGVYAVVIELLTRGVSRDPMSYPLRGQATLGSFFFVLGVIVIVAAGRVRRAMLARGRGSPGERIQGASIVALALAEMPAVFGLVVFLTTGQRDSAYALLLLSLVGLALYFPRWSQWEEWAREFRMTSR